MQLSLNLVVGGIEEVVQGVCSAVYENLTQFRYPYQPFLTISTIRTKTIQYPQTQIYLYILQRNLSIADMLYSGPLAIADTFPRN